MESHWGPRPLVRALALLAGAVAVWHLATLLNVVGSRLRFAHDIDWLEGGEIYHAFRFARGEAIYRPPSDGFIPYPYPPVYFVLLAGIGQIAGIDYGSARALSAFALLVIIVVMAAEMRAHVGAGRAGALAALLGAAGVACTYPDVVGFYDLARVDTLAFAFVVASTFAILRKRVVWAALGATCAVYTKQTMVFPVVALMVLMFVQGDRKSFFRFTLVAGTLSLAALGILQWRTGGTFLMWMLDTRHHNVEPRRLGVAARELMLSAPWLAVPLVALWRRPISARTATWLAVLCGSLVASILPYIKAGGFANNFIPILAIAAPTAWMVLLDLTRASKWPWHSAVLAAAGFALLGKVYDADPYRPNRDAVARANDLSVEIRALTGDVLCPLHPFVVTRSGHPEEQLGWLNHIDAVGGKTGVALDDYMRVLLQRRPEYVLLDDEDIESPIARGIAADYVFLRELRGPKAGSVTGMDTVPTKLYRHR